jgi:hypothetical protein
MYESGDESSGHGDRQADEVFLINLDQTFSQHARARRLHVEARQPEGAADEEHKGEKPA